MVSRAWFAKFSSAVERAGFFRSSSDHSFFIKRSTRGMAFLLVYVDDDIVFTGNEIHSLEEFSK